jgi:ABC-type lipoprotein release transport system permease subunit
MSEHRRAKAKILRLAWRNLGRNRRRTLITGLALALGTSLCVVTYGLMDGMNADILRALTRLDLGHVQLHEPDFPKKRLLKRTIPGADALAAAAAKLEEVEAVSRRVYGFGLAGHQSKSAGVQLVGVDPASEPRVTELHKQIKQGEYLDRAATPWPAGRALSDAERKQDARLTQQAEDAVLAEIEALGQADDDTPTAPTPAGKTRAQTQTLATTVSPPPSRPPRVFIGVNLAKILKVKLGDKLHIMSQTVDGLSAEGFFEVKGIFDTGTDIYDRGRVYLHLTDLQRFLRLTGRVHEITVRARSDDDAPTIAAALKMRTGGGGAMVRTWDEIRPDIKNILQINSASTGLMVFIIFIVAALGVVNTMLMAVFERTRELGMLKAIGMSGGKIMWLIVVETTLLVLMASLVGAAAGLGLDLYLMHSGIDLRSFSEGISIGGMGVSPVLHAAITPEGVLVPVLTLGLMCFLAAFYPAARAARMRPAQGMREGG